ncbi:hypothetical protein Fcan01_24828 [Folsomia candida]|uniref:Uncharacterized protein n=1 Tax=Folsomia candida TaxID=158441 RepID=A0A226D5M9_FOLCA|nr:hypothetical protein Fcan01_24828 [Folsomia candida]
MLSSTVPLILAVATLGPLAAVAQLNPTEGEPGGVSPIYYLQFILANSLKLGDSCSWSDEALRQSAFREMKRFPKNSRPYDQAFYNIVTSTVENGRTFCMAKEMLWDAGTGKKVCRWSQGGSCESPPDKQASFVRKCAQGLSCTYLKDRTECTNLSTLKYVLDAMRNNVPRDEALDGILSGKMCQCVSEEDNGLDKDKFAMTRSNGRFRRSVGRNGDDLYARAKAALFTPGAIDM